MRETAHVPRDHLIHSLAYHPQTDGQTEPVNQILEDMFRACVLEHQGSWDKNLPYTEFFTMGHDDIYEWTLNDLGAVNDLEGEQEYLNVVFHGIYNDMEPDNDMISLYIKNGEAGAATGFVQKNDPNLPDTWDNWIAFDGTWGFPTPADPADWGYQDGSIAFDVVFSLLIDETIEAILTDGGTFTLGIDSDCRYFGEKITAEAPAPVPEPATMFLLGSGLIGIAGIGRKRNKKTLK